MSFSNGFGKGGRNAHELPENPRHTAESPLANGKPAKPAPLPVIAENVPEVLRRQVRWVCWNWVWKPQKNQGKGGWDKPPFHPSTGSLANATDPHVWVPFETALRAHQRGDFDGIGIVLGQLVDRRLTLAGMDLDGSRDPTTGILTSWARFYLSLLSTYCEVSPSHTGVKALAFGTLPADGRNNRRGVELYDSGRYFTVTGHRIPDYPADVREATEALTRIHATAFAETAWRPASPSDWSDRDLALAALQGLQRERAFVYADWLGVGMALHAVDPSDGMCEEWDRWSRQCPEKYGPGECAKKWRSFHPGGGIGLGSLLYWARQDGWTLPRKERAGPLARLDVPAAPPPWEDYIPLGPEYIQPAFPLDVLPSWLRNWCEAEAVATQTPLDLAAVLALTACGAGLARKYRVRIRPGWSEPTNLLTVVALPSGDRKSTVLADVIAPIEAHEAAEQARLAPLIATAQSEHRVLEAQLAQLERLAGKEKDAEERERLKHEAKQAARQVAEHVVPEPPQFIADDETPANLARLLSLHEGRMFQASAEGTAFENCTGRYSECLDFDVYLKGHAGDPLRVGRIGREQKTVLQPALSAALAVQPDVIRGLGAYPFLKGKGFLARWLYSLPPSWVGNRRIAPPAVPKNVQAAYQTTLERLWKLKGAVDPKTHQPTPHWLELEPEADQMMQELERWLEPQLAEGEALSTLAGWGSKLAGAIARLAAILHVAGTVAEGAAVPEYVSGATLRAAVALGRDYFLPHAQAAFGLMEADPLRAKAEKIAHWIAREGCSEFKRHEVYNDVRNQAFFPKIEDLDAPLGVLARHNVIRIRLAEKKDGPGRPPHPVYEVNPRWLEDQKNQKNQKNSREPGEEG
jgi:hypothetical protein